MQLFLIPGLIVAIIVVVWLLFHWLAQMGNDSREYIKKLRGNSEMRWQAAVNLAGALHGEAGADIKKDPAVAADLAQILDDEIHTAGMDENSINMRIYLCRALGEFQTPLVLPALLKAAQTQRDDAEIDVRRAAVQGIAALAHTLDAMHQPLDDAEVVPVLIEATKSENNNLRTESAFALGEFDDPQATLRLEQMLDDPYPDARFNAATGLAHYGREQSLPVLLEMLDPEQSLATKEERPEDKKQKQIQVNVTALHAVLDLAAAKPDVDLSRALEAVDKLAKSDIPEIRENAMATKEMLEKRPAAAAK